MNEKEKRAREKYNLDKNTLVFAKLHYWNGSVEEIEIKAEYIDDILDAVTGQFTFIDRERNFGVRGEQISHVDILTQKQKEN